MESPRSWRPAGILLAAAVLAAAAGNAQAAYTTILPGDLAGASVRPYTGPANPILHFTGSAGGGNPDVATVASALGYAGPVDASHCTRLNSPAGPSGTVFLNGVIFNYQYDPSTQTTYFNWDANAPVMWVTAKGGNEAYVFGYTSHDVNPADGLPDGELEDTALRSPANSSGDPASLSHFDFCFREPPPTISKTAVGSWTRFHDWTLDKGADPDSIRMFDGDSHDVDYTITATKTPWGTYTVSGVIDISDPLDRGFTVDSVADTIVFTNDPANPKNNFHPALQCMPVDDGDVFHRCTYSITLSSKTYSFLAGGGVNAASAQLSLNGNTMMIATTANFTFPASPSAEFGASLVVDDTMVPGSPDHTFNASGSWMYTHTFICPDNEGGNPNTATGTWSTGPSTSAQTSASENVAVVCEVVQISKTADTSFDVDYAWTADKKIVVRPVDVTEEDKATHCSLITSGIHTGNYACDDITLILNSGNSYATEYQLNAVRSAPAESGWKVFGQITVSWPSGMSPVFSGDPTDTLHFAAGLPATQDAVVSNCVDGVDSFTCDYTADLAAKRDGVNWASIVRPHLCFDSGGNEVACLVPDSTTYKDDAAFAFGSPTTSTDECVAMSDLFNDGGFNTGPTFWWEVDAMVCNSTVRYVTGNVGPGDLTIFADWFPGTEEEFIANECLFQVPNLLDLLTNDTQTSSSDGANISVFVSDLCDRGCTLTQGYWKTHSRYGPAPYDDTWALVGEDTMFYTSGLSWHRLFWTPPQGGNAYIQLAHQYMAAKLNVLAEAGVPSQVASAISQAEALFPLATTYNKFGQRAFGTKAHTNQARQLAGLLASYNEGSIGPGHCSEAPARSVLMAR